MQQSGAQTEVPKSAVQEEDKQRDIRKTFKILKEVWLNIGVEKVDMYENITVKVLLDSGATGMFMDRKMVVRNRFKLQKLERLLVVRNIDSTNNSGGAITYQVEVNMYYKSHVKRIRIDIYDLGRTNIILGILQLQVHNSKINQKTREVKMMRCLPIYGRSIVTKKKTEKKRKIERRIRAIEKSEKNEWKMLMKEKFDDKVELDREKVRKIVPQRFYKWLKVFKKVELEKIPVRKPWDHVMNLRKDFVPKKERTYSILKEENEKIREFIEEQLRKGYIRLSKLFQTSPVFFVGKKNRKKRIVQGY